MANDGTQEGFNSIAQKARDEVAAPMGWLVLVAGGLWVLTKVVKGKRR